MLPSTEKYWHKSRIHSGKWCKSINPHTFRMVIYMLHNSCLKCSCKIDLGMSLDTGCCKGKWKNWSSTMRTGKFVLSKFDMGIDIWCILGQYLSLQYCMSPGINYHSKSESYRMYNYQLSLSMSYNPPYMELRFQSCWCIRSEQSSDTYPQAKHTQHHSFCMKFNLNSSYIQLPACHIRDMTCWCLGSKDLGIGWGNRLSRRERNLMFLCRMCNCLE